jgi:hypothetical protein
MAENERRKTRARTRSNSGGVKSESHRRGRSNAVASHGRNRSGAISAVDMLRDKITSSVTSDLLLEEGGKFLKAAEIILEYEQKPGVKELNDAQLYGLINDIWEASKGNISPLDINKIRKNKVIQRYFTHKLRQTSGQDFLEIIREYYMEKEFFALTVIKSEFGRTGSRSNELELIAKDEELSPLLEFLNNFSNDVNTIYSTVIKSIKTNLFDNSISINDYLARLNNSFAHQDRPSPDEGLILDIVQAVRNADYEKELAAGIKATMLKHAPKGQKEIITRANEVRDFNGETELDRFIKKIIIGIDNKPSKEDLDNYLALKRSNLTRLEDRVKAIIAKIAAKYDKNIGETLHELVEQDSNDRAILKALCGYNEVEGLTNEEIIKIRQMAEDSNTRLSKSSYRQSVGTFTSIWDYIRSILDKIFNNKHKTTFSWKVEGDSAEGNESSEEKSSEEDKRAEEALDTEANHGEIPKEEGAALRELELRKQAEEAEAKAISELQEMGSSLQEDVRSEKALRAEAKAIKELQDMSLNLSEVSTKEELNTPSTDDVNREEPPKVSSLIDKFNTLIENHTKAARKFADWKENKNKGTKKE